MSFLSKLSKIRKSTTASKVTIQDPSPKKIDRERSLLPKNYIRDEDPAVKRLKELRRQELLKNGALAKKSGVKRKRSTSSGSEKRDRRGMMKMKVAWESGSRDLLVPVMRHSNQW